MLTKTTCKHQSIDVQLVLSAVHSRTPTRESLASRSLLLRVRALAANMATATRGIASATRCSAQLPGVPTTLAVRPVRARDAHPQRCEGFFMTLTHIRTRAWALRGLSCHGGGPGP